MSLKKSNIIQKQYFTTVSRKLFYGVFAVIIVALVAFLLFVPHPRKLVPASLDTIQQAHHDVILQTFVQSTTCKNDNRSKPDRIKTYTSYFKVNQYANRALVRGCNDADSMYAKLDSGKWVRTNVNIVLSSRQNPSWQKACLIDDITTADTKVRPENSSIDANNKAICDKLRKTSFIHI